MNSKCRSFVGRARRCRPLVKSLAKRLAGRAIAILGTALAAVSHAQVVAPLGCPLFHCTAEATGVMPFAAVQQVPVMTSNSALGRLRFQGCSGDGARLACLYDGDTAPAASAGTLKVLDASTLQPIWASGASVGSYDPIASDTSGQVPVMLADGRIAAGDSKLHALYGPGGVAASTLTVGGSGINFGLTPISDTLGIVSQADGVLTLVDLVAWQALDVLVLRDPLTQAHVSLVSPSSGTAGVLYAVGATTKSNRGLLFAVGVDPVTNKLVVRSSFAFVGRSGASPVVVTPAASGLSTNMVLLHAPGLAADAVPRDRLIGLLDSGIGLSAAWTLQLDAALPVAPTIDRVTQTLFYVYKSDTKIHQVSLLTGQAVRDFDIGAIAAMPAGFTLNGHLAATQWGTTFTVLLSGSVPAGQSGSGQFVMAFQPVDRPNALLWLKKIANRPDSYTAAWNLAPSLQAGIWCPIVVGTGSGITRLCDFAP